MRRYAFGIVPLLLFSVTYLAVVVVAQRVGQQYRVLHRVYDLRDDYERPFVCHTISTQQWNAMKREGHLRWRRDLVRAAVGLKPEVAF